MSNYRYCVTCGCVLNVDVPDWRDVCWPCYEEQEKMAKKKSKTTKPKRTKKVEPVEQPKKAEAPRLEPVFASPSSDRILGWRMMNIDGQELYTTWFGDERPEGYQEPQTSLSESEIRKTFMQQRTDEVIKSCIAAPITEHEGRKYLRKITSCLTGESIQVDVYDVLEAFGVTSQPIGHAIKKLLACGQRGKGDKIADLKGVLAAVNRAIEQEERKNA